MPPAALRMSDGVDEGLGLLEYLCTLAQPGFYCGSELSLVVSEELADLAESGAPTEEELFCLSDPPQMLLHLIAQRARVSSLIVTLAVSKPRCFALEALR